MTIIANTLPVFPTCPTYGFSARPSYLVRPTSREGGFERRDRKWAQPLHYYDGVPTGDRPERDIEVIRTFFHAMGGTTERFLFTDYQDYKSTVFASDDVTPLDQPFIVAPGSPGFYQLVKEYAVGTYITQRTIRHPIGSTLRVANNVGVEQAASRWSIDENTGLLSMLGGFVGTPGRWGGEFYVPVNFAADISIEMSNFEIQNASVSLKELRPSDT